MDEKTQKFVDKALAVHNNKYDYSLVEYQRQYSLVDIICPQHGVFHQTPKLHLKGHGCRKCSGCEADQDTFLKKARAKHGDKFDYSLTVYTGSRDKIIIICQKHGQSEMIAGNHIYISHGCAKCGHEEANIKKTLTQEEFINKAIIVHGSTFDYSQTVYKSAQKKVIICCKEHGPFEQKAASHLDGCGCPYCMGVIRTTARFIEKALLIHGTKYSYDKSNYINSKSKIIITCPDHGDFKVVASEFLRGGGCRGCMTSHPETTWLNSLNVPVRQHKVQFDGHYIVVDGYDPVTNTCYEFHGDFWHGNPALYSPNEINKISKISFGELYERTKKREQLITESGYNLVVMWEDEWNKINK